MIEPSNIERANLPDTTRDYLYELERNLTAALARADALQSERDWTQGSLEDWKRSLSMTIEGNLKCIETLVNERNSLQKANENLRKMTCQADDECTRLSLALLDTEKKNDGLQRKVEALQAELNNEKEQLSIALAGKRIDAKEVTRLDEWVARLREKRDALLEEQAALKLQVDAIKRYATTENCDVCPAHLTQHCADGGCLENVFKALADARKVVAT